MKNHRPNTAGKPTDALQRANEAVRHGWNQTATFWDQRMGDGNEFVEVLIWPDTERLLDLRPGERVLDIACGTGLSSRRLAAKGAEVVAFDFAENMIARARARPHPQSEHIQYKVLDVRDEAALLSLGERRFDAALCHMALFDMADLSPLLRALARLLRPGGRFVFSVLHPCFNSARHALVAEKHEEPGGEATLHAVKIFGYLQSHVRHIRALHDQPEPNPLFHRPLQELFGVCFAAGLALDGLAEPAFPADSPPRRDPLSWGTNLREIPPVLIARMRLLPALAH